MIDVLNTINNELIALKIPYTFNRWDSEIELPQFIGEIYETSNPNEDGKSEYNFILNGYGVSYEELFAFSETLKKRYKYSVVVDDVVITYNNTSIISNGTEDLKQIQINFNIKKWSV